DREARCLGCHSSHPLCLESLPTSFASPPNQESTRMLRLRGSTRHPAAQEADPCRRGSSRRIRNFRTSRVTGEPGYPKQREGGDTRQAECKRRPRGSHVETKNSVASGRRTQKAPQKRLGSTGTITRMHGAMRVRLAPRVSL